MAYNLQEWRLKNYKELEKVDLPWAQRVKAADRTALYQVKVLERENEQVKVHWDGYSHKDEWIGCAAERKC